MSAQPASNLPKNVRAQVALANKIVAEMNAPPAAEPPTAVVPPATPPPPAAATPPATPPTPPAAATPPTPPVSPPADDAAEQRYKVLQGKYNAEVPRLQRRVQEQDEQLRDLKQQLLNQQSLLAGLSARTPPSTPPAATPNTPRVTAEEITAFGPDLIDVMKRVAQDTILPEIDARVKPVAAQVERTQQNTKVIQDDAFRMAREKLIDQLRAAVPNFVQVNGESGFIAWLQQADPYAGRLREDLLQEAYKANDGPRVIAFFTGYLAENAATTVPPPPAPVVPPAAQTEAQKTMASLVAPGTPKSGPGSAPTDSGKRVWTHAEIGTLFQQIQGYAVKGKKVPDELRAQERDVHKAQHEGRVRHQ